MDLPKGSLESRLFVCSPGLITSNGPNGPNIMTAEWTRHVSYSPGLIQVNFLPSDATLENIEKTREFGVNLVSEALVKATSTAGHYTGREVDKHALLKQLGVEFYDPKKIKAPMVKGATLNLECRVVKREAVGDHLLVIGEVLDVSRDENAVVVAYRDGKFYKLGELVPRPDEVEAKSIDALAEKFRKK